MAQLGINIDHVATIRQARMGMEPDPVYAAYISEQNGADQITIHLREDRRHIQFRDAKLLKDTIQTRLNLEMAATPEMVTIAKNLMPHTVTLVPEKREEVTTEGGLDISPRKIEEVIAELQAAGIEVSVFIEPDLDMIKIADRYKANAVEIHTGRYANAKNAKEVVDELKRIEKACKVIRSANMRVVAGHGINYHNITQLVQLQMIEEYNIGHSIISRAIFNGLAEAVQTMKMLINSR
jgi:pyridoxine 5-phosphate synthase